MNFKQFLLIIQEAVETKLGDGCSSEILEVPQINGTTYVGLRIGESSERMVPIIHIETYYEQFKQGMQVDNIVEDIVNIFRNNRVELGEHAKDIFNFNKMSSKVVCKIVNTEANQQLLQTIPSIPWMDLSVIFYLILKKNEEGQMTALISDEHIEKWGVTAEELYILACMNTKRLLPTKIKHMSEVMLEILKDMEIDAEEEMTDVFCGSNTMPMYVLSNSTGLHGACCMLPGFGIEEFAHKIDTNFVVLPSSTHEVLLVPVEEGMDVAGLSELVKEINETQVPVEDRLSDGIYYFDREIGMKKIEDGKKVL